MDYSPHTDSDRQKILNALQIRSVEDLLTDIPAELRLSKLALAPGLSELEVVRLARDEARRNLHAHAALLFRGGGVYEHYIPAVVDAMLSRAEFYTSYTPYQAEASQGNLQAMFEFQSMICALTEMDVANSSLYDGPSAAAEAVLLALRATTPSGRRRVLVSRAVHPHTRSVIKTYIQNLDVQLEEIPLDEQEGTTDLGVLRQKIGQDVSAVVMAQPNCFGALESMEEAGRLAHAAGALFVASVYPISLGILAPPGSYGADIAVGDGQSLGNWMAGGGPTFGFFAARQSLLRRMPGRLVGVAFDQQSRRGFTLTLQAREQHIRREKATSNICTNQSLNALAGAVYLSWLGPQGLKELATLNVARSHRACEQLIEKTGAQPIFRAKFFNEFALRWSESPHQMETVLAERGVISGLPLGPWDERLSQASLWCVTETKSNADIGHLVSALQRVPAWNH